MNNMRTAANQKAPAKDSSSSTNTGAGAIAKAKKTPSLA